jgi:hypothetical protein
MSSPVLRKGHSSGLDMVQVSDDPFRARTPSHPLDLPEEPGTLLVRPVRPAFDSYYDESPRSTTHLINRGEQDVSTPGWEQRRFPLVPAIHIQSASTDDYGEYINRPASYVSFTSSMIPLETPEEERYIRNPFIDPTEYTNMEFVNAMPAVTIQPIHKPVIKENASHARTAARTSRMTMKSLKADVVSVPSPVDAIDRFWDIPTTLLNKESRLSPATPSSSTYSLRSVSPGPTSRH